MPEPPRARTIPTAAVTAAVLLLSSSFGLVVRGNPSSDYAIEKIFYGRGWVLDTVTGVRRQIAFLNLTQVRTDAFPENGTFIEFSQIFTEFSLPGSGSGPPDGPALRVRFSYYVQAECINLNASTCPLGSNTTAISQDVLDLEVRRLLEYRDANSNGAYDPGELVAREINYAQPESPFAFFFPFGANWADVSLPYAWNRSSPDEELAIGALFKEDPLLEDLSGFEITVGDGTPANFTMYSYFFLRPSAYKGIPLTPTQLKLDVYIEHHSGFAAEDTAVALEWRLSSTQHRFAITANGTSESLTTSSEAAQAFFSWSTNATVDGVSRPVRSNVLSANESATVYLSYPRGGVIWHDPILGLGSVGGSPDGGSSGGGGTGSTPWRDPGLWVVLAATIVATAAVGYFAFRRRR